MSSRPGHSTRIFMKVRCDPMERSRMSSFSCVREIPLLSYSCLHFVAPRGMTASKEVRPNQHVIATRLQHAHLHESAPRSDERSRMSLFSCVREIPLLSDNSLHLVVTRGMTASKGVRPNQHVIAARATARTS